MCDTHLDFSSFSTSPKEWKPCGYINIDKMYNFDLIMTVLNPESGEFTRTNHGTIKLTPEEYTYILNTDPRTGEQYVPSQEEHND